MGKDMSGNWNDAAGQKCTGARKYTRTVVVVDTLRPVVSLKYNGVSIQQSAPHFRQKENGHAQGSDNRWHNFDQIGAVHNNAPNPAIDANAPRFRVHQVRAGSLMAESSPHAWTRAHVATASGVVGIMLLGIALF